MAERLEDRRLLAVVNWDGGGGDLNWNNPANWDTDQLPGAADDVRIADVTPDIAIFHSSGTTSINSLVSDEALVISGGTLDIAAASSINDNLTLGTSSSAYLTGAGDVTVGGLFTWTGGRVRGTGTLIASGGMQIEGTGTKYLERTVDNAGTATWTGGSISASADGVLNNLVGATFDVQTSNQMFGQFINDGTFIKSNNTSTATFYNTFNNNGSVQVQTGTLALNNGGDSSGSFQVDTDATLRLQGGTHNLDASATLSGAGTLTITTNGVLDVANNINIGSLDLLSSSSSFNPILKGSGDVTVDGLFEWTGGRLQGTGKLIANGGMQISGRYDKYLERTLDNAAIANWTDGIIRTSPDGVFNNLDGATFDAKADDLFSGATGTFNNTGTLLKSAGTGLSSFSSVVTNTGTVHTQSGTLNFSGGGSSSSSFQIDAGANLRISSNTFVLNDGWDVAGPGNLLITGGTVNVAANGNVDNLTLGTSSSAYLTGAGDVTVGGLFTWTGGRVRGTGTLIASGGMQIEGTGTKYLERTVDNAGTATWTGGSISASADGVLNNLVGATFDVQTSNQMFGQFINDGTFIKSNNTSTATFYNTFNNNGSVQVQTGTLALNNGGDSSGSFQVDTDATLRLQGGTHNLDASATLSGAGTLTITTNGVLDVANNINIGSLDLLSSSSSFNPILKGSGDVTVDGLFEWTGGRLQGTGKLIANGGMQISGRYDKYLERTLDNAAIANWTDGIIRTSPDGVFNNLDGATFDAKADDLFSGATGTFNNTGTLLKSAGTGLSSFSSVVTNTGTVHTQSGTLNFSGGGSSSSSFQIDAGANLRISSNTFVLNDGWDVAGPGNLLITGGTVNVAANGNVDNLTLGTSSSAYLTGAGDVTVGGLFTWTGGRVRGTGTLIASGGMQIEGTGTKYLERTVDNAGTATWTGGSISASADGVLNNLVGATFDVQTSNQMFGQFINDGTFIKSNNTSTATFYNTFNNNGSVQVQTGTLALNNGGDSSGSFQVDTDATLRLQGGTHNLDASATLSGAGTLTITTNGVLDVANNINIGSLDVLSSSSSFNPILKGSGDVTVDGLFEWTGGRLQGTGKLIANGGMQISGRYDKYLERTLDNAAIANWTDGIIRTSPDGVFNNLDGATFDAKADDLFSGATGTFNNTGTLLKSAGTGLSSFSSVVTNTGTVHTQSGTLNFSGGGSSSSSFQIDAGANLRISSNTFVLNDGWDVAGPGNLLITGGTVNVAANGNVDNLTLGTSSSAYLTGAGDVTVGGLFTWTGGRVRGTGTLIASGGMQIEGTGTKYLERTVDNAGTATWTGGSISASADGVLNNLVGATFDVQTSNQMFGQFINDGTFIKSNNTSTATFYNTFNNNGSVQVQTGTLYFPAGFTQTAGETLLDGGNLNSNTPFEFQGGVLAGFGVVIGDVVMGGLLEPNSSADDFGSIQITGDYIQSPSLDAGGPYAVDEEGSVQLDATLSSSNGIIEIEIGGIATYDQLDVDDNLTLMGPLNVVLSGGYEPSVGDTFTIVNNAGSDTITGVFAGLPDGATFTVGNTQFQISYSGGTDSNDVVLTAVDPTNPDQGGDTFAFQWDLDGDGNFGETGVAAERGDELGASVSFSAEGLEGPATFPVGVRAAFNSGAFSAVSATTVELSDSPAEPLPDLLVSSTNISFSPATPSPGESVTILATIENVGQIAASDLLVDLYDSGSLLQQITIPSLAVGATQDVSVTTSFADLGPRSITARIDPLDSIMELNEDNNEATKTLQVSDSTPPVTSVTRSVDANAAGWNNTDVGLTLSSIDEVSGSGISQITYSINGAAPVTQSGDTVDLSFTEEGIYTVAFYAVDVALNAETQRSVQVKIDKTAPTPVFSGPFAVDEGSSALPDGSASSDLLSGVGSIQWAIGDGEFEPENTPIFSSLDGPSTQDVVLRVTDLAGNEATITSQVVVNNVAPTATISTAGTFTYGQSATVSLVNPMDPSPADTAAGFRYSFGLSSSELADTYLDADASSAWSTPLPVGTDTVYGRIFDIDDAYSNFETTVTVEQATLTVTADDLTTPYSGAAFSDFTVSYAGFVGGDDENALEGSLIFSGSAIGAIDVGEYTVNATGLTSGNYVINFASGQLTIEKTDANIVVSGQTVTYDGTEYSATGSATGVDNQPLAGLDLGSGFIDAPGGTANWTFTDETGNYNDASGSVAINIAKAAQTINWATPDSIVQGTPLSAAQLNATVSVVGPASAGELQYAPDFGTVLGIGENELTVTAAETANYRQANASVFLTVEDPNVAPAIVLASSSTSAVRDAQFTFDGSFTDPDADNWTATVNYGDGSGDQPLALNGKNFQLAHTYDTEGPFVVVITVDDGKGGVDSKNLTVVVQPPPRADVTLISADVLFNPINPNPEDPVNFEIDVSNDGNIAANNVTVSVQVFDGAGGVFQEIGRPVIGSIPGNSEAPVTLTWTGTDQPALPSEDTYLLVRVVLDPDNTIQEESESNNEAIQVLQIGSPDFGTATLTANVNPFTTTRGTYTPVGGQAYYNFSTIPGDNDFPVQNASVTARLIDPATGEVLRVSGAQTAPNGNFLHFFRAPEVDGTYTLQYEVNEGTLSAVFESTLTVAGEPTETPPRARGPGGPGYVFSASVVPPESLEIGVPSTILGSFNYDLDDELDVDVTFNNLFPVAGKLQTFEIGSSEITFPEGGIDEPLIEPMEWIPTAEGYHILQVIAEPSVPLRAHLRATQLVLVGDLDTTSLNVEYDAVVTGSGGSGGEGEEGGSGVQAPSPGDRLLFALTYENTGTTTITGGFLMDNFDETLVGIPFNVSDGGVVDGNSVRWELGDIEPGETGFVTYEVIINSEAEFPAGSAYLLNTAILNADQSATATTSEIVISNNAPVISGLEVNPFVDENGGVTLAGTFSDASIEDTHEVSITWGDGTSDTLTFSQGERSFSIEHTYDLDGLSGLQSFPIAVSVTDGSDQSANGSVTTQAELGAPPVANAGGPYTITVGENLTLDASESADPDGDPLTFGWDLTGNLEYTDATDASPALNWQSLVALGINAPGEYEVAVQVTSGTDSDVATTTLNVLYATPTVNVDWTGGVYSGIEFSASGSVIGFDDSVIAAPTFAYYVGDDTSGNSLPAAPIAAGTYTVEATFAGDNLHAPASATSTIVIDKANALIQVDGTTATYDGTAYGATGSATGVAGEPLPGLDLGESFTDAPGGSATWTFTDETGNYIDATGSVEIGILKASQAISWAVPASIEQGTPLSDAQLNATAIGAGPSPAGALSYSPPAGTVLEVGFHMLTVTAAETLNYLPATASVTITVSGATIADGSLLIVGTEGNDHILLTQIGSLHLVTADFLPGWLHTKSFRHGDYQRIAVYAGDGNDTVLTLPNLGHNMLINGGVGNDHLVSGRGDDVLIGGDGNDVLIGGQGRDLLIGGKGADQLFASSGSDLLIAGYTAFDDRKEPLLSISDEWSSNRNYTNRRENLLGTNQNSSQFDQRLNDGYFLANFGEDQTVFADADQDYLVGGGGRDWYFADLANDEDENDYFLGLRENEHVEWTRP